MTTYQTTAQILERQQLTVAADAKPGADVTEDDLKHLSTERLRTLMNAGELTHLGIGKRH